MKLLIARVVLTWLAVWPTVTVLLLAVRSVSPDLPLLSQTLILTSLFVPLSVVIIAPQVNRFLAQHPRRGSQARSKSSGDNVGG